MIFGTLHCRLGADNLWSIDQPSQLNFGFGHLNIKKQWIFWLSESKWLSYLIVIVTVFEVFRQNLAHRKKFHFWLSIVIMPSILTNFNIIFISRKNFSAFDLKYRKVELNMIKAWNVMYKFFNGDGMPVECQKWKIHFI